MWKADRKARSALLNKVTVKCAINTQSGEDDAIVWYLD